VPPSDSKREGPDSGDDATAFFDEGAFDPDASLAYLRRLEIRNSAVDLDAFSALNP
jgi:hypothetical protein